MRARRGDVVVVSVTRRDYVIGQASTTRDEHVVAVVTSVTRDGEVKAWRQAGSHDGYGETVRARAGAVTLSIVPRDSVDVAAVIADAAAHCWPGHPDQSMPFASLDAVRDVIKPHRT